MNEWTLFHKSNGLDSGSFYIQPSFYIQFKREREREREKHSPDMIQCRNISWNECPRTLNVAKTYRCQRSKRPRSSSIDKKQLKTNNHPLPWNKGCISIVSDAHARSMIYAFTRASNHASTYPQSHNFSLWSYTQSVSYRRIQHVMKPQWPT